MTMIDKYMSQTAKAIRRSVMRDLMSLVVDPSIISLAGGLPANDCLPVEEFAVCADRVLRRDGYRALQYGPPFRPLQEWIATYMARQGVQCGPDQVFLTNGAQQGLAILSRLFCDPGDVAVIEAVTFTGIQQVTLGRRLIVRTVPTHLESGIDVAALAEAFQKAPRPRMAILIPNFHNPLGVSIDLEKRKRIIHLAREFRLPIIEDDPYSPLRFEGKAPPPLKALDISGHIFYIGTFSKMLAPAVRSGWIVAPESFADRITVMRESFDLESSQLVQRTVAEFLTSGYLPAHLKKLNETNLRRRNALLNALQMNLAPLGAQWTLPEGGIFVWVTLPKSIDTWKLFKDAIEQKVAYIPGAAFAVEGGYQNTMRLNFSNVCEENMAIAIKRIADVVRNFLEKEKRAWV